MNNREVAHAFVGGTAGAEGSHFRTVKGTEGATVLMSYGTPVGIRMTVDNRAVVYLDNRKYSHSTTVNVNMVKHAAPDYIGMAHEEFVKLAKKYGANFSLARG